MADPSLKSFTSWKLDWINALMIGVDAREFRVAVCLLQFANSESRMIFPSQARIACILGCGTATVERAVGKLVADGWLERMRANRHFPNFYRFVETKRDAMRDLRIARDDTFTESRWGRPEPSELMGQKRPEPSGVMGLEPSGVMGLEPSGVMGKHLDGTPEGEHLNQAGAEDEVPSLGVEVSFDGEPAGAVAPHNASKPAGGSHPPAPSSSLLNSKAFLEARNGHVTVDPFTSLDRLEADIKAGRYRR